MIIHVISKRNYSQDQLKIISIKSKLNLFYIIHGAVYYISLSTLISIIFLEYHFLAYPTLAPLLQYGPASKFLPAVFHVKFSRVTIPGKQVCFPC